MEAEKKFEIQSNRRLQSNRRCVRELAMADQGLWVPRAGQGSPTMPRAPVTNDKLAMEVPPGHGYGILRFFFSLIGFFSCPDIPFLGELLW